MNPATLRAKQMNKRKIATYVIIHEEATRIEIASALGISTGTVTNIVTELIRENLLYESRKTNISAGRKTTFLKFNGGISYILCVEISSKDDLILSVCDLLGTRLYHEAYTVPFLITDDNPTNSVLRMIIDIVTEYLGNLSEDVREKICAIGVSICGMVDSKQFVDIPIYNWKNINLKAPLQTASKLPVYVENVTRIKSVYEMRWVKPQEKNVLYLNMSPGIGITHYFGGSLIEGHTGISGEAGHMSLNIHGEKCYCGNRGCFELYCDQRAIISRARALLTESNRNDPFYDLAVNQEEPVTLDLIAKAHSMGSLAIQGLLLETAEYLGSGIANLYNIFDPDRLIISGLGADFDSFLINAATAEAKSRIVNIFGRDLNISSAHLKGNENYKAVSAYVLQKQLNILI